MVYVFLAIAFGLTFVHRVVGRRYLDEYVAVYGRLPDRRWFFTRDENETVESWRRKRLAVIVPELGAFLIAMFMLLQPVARS